jgi:hypothetical protein
VVRRLLAAQPPGQSNEPKQPKKKSAADDSVSLADLVRDFNAENKKLERGLDQPPLTEDELRATAAWYMDLVTNMQCELDGRSFNGLESYRVAGEPFGVNLPSGNLWEFFGCATPAGSYSPLVPDGTYLMLAPLSVGQHTLHFTGTVGAPVNFTLEITYHLTVAPTGHFEVASRTAQDDEAPAALGVKRSTWGRVKAIYR